MSRIFVLLMLLPLATVCQRKFNFTAFAGFSNYSGDLQEKSFTRDQSHQAFGVGISMELRPKLLLHGTLKTGKLSGDDKFSSNPFNRDRNLNFSSHVFDAALTLEYSIFYLYYSRISPYVFAGGAIFSFNPKTIARDGREVALRDMSTEGQGFANGRMPYRLIAISIPMGVGLKLRVTDNAYIGYEIGVRKTFTDYIDDVSKTYVDRELLLARRGLQAVQLAFRGDELKSDLPYPPINTVRGGSRFKDWYYFSGITLSIGIANADGTIFGKRVTRGSTDCPAIKM